MSRRSGKRAVWTYVVHYTGPLGFAMTSRHHAYTKVGARKQFRKTVFGKYPIRRIVLE